MEMHLLCQVIFVWRSDVLNHARWREAAKAKSFAH